VPAVHVLLWQVSAPLHTLPSLHAVPFGTPVFEHPVVGPQASVVHGLLSLQLSAVPAVQTPPWQVSLPLHRLPSAHAVPLASAVAVHPEVGLQASVVHGLPSLQTSAAPATHTPAWQVSAPLQRLPSGHAVPLASTTLAQMPALHESIVHGFESL